MAAQAGCPTFLKDVHSTQHRVQLKVIAAEGILVQQKFPGVSYLYESVVGQGAGPMVTDQISLVTKAGVANPGMLRMGRPVLEVAHTEVDATGNLIWTVKGDRAIESIVIHQASDRCVPVDQNPDRCEMALTGAALHAAGFEMQCTDVAKSAIPGI